MSGGITSFEAEVLAMMDGSGPALSWGAAMGATLEFLSGVGLCTRGPNYQITDKGKAALARRRKYDAPDASVRQP